MGGGGGKISRLKIYDFKMQLVIGATYTHTHTHTHSREAEHPRICVSRPRTVEVYEWDGAVEGGDITFIQRHEHDLETSTHKTRRAKFTTKYSKADDSARPKTSQ